MGFAILAEKGTWCANVHHPHANTETIVGHVYLDHSLLEKKGLDVAEVSRLVVQELIELDGIGYAISSTDLVAGCVPDAPIARQVKSCAISIPRAPAISALSMSYTAGIEAAQVE